MNVNIKNKNMKQIDNCTLYCGDCLKIMNKIPDKSIDLVLCDLPYGTTPLEWDKVLDFKNLFKIYERVLTDNGTLALFGCEPFSTKLRNSFEEYYKYDLYWIKNRVTCFTLAKVMPLKNVELISIFSKGTITNRKANNMTYNPQGLKKCLKKEENYKKRKSDSFGKHYKLGSKNDYVKENTNYPTLVLNFDSCLGEFHPTQKPVKLLEYLIKTYTNENDLVLDNTMGSGSTGVACQNTHRKFIGIEKDKKYFKIAYDRMKSNRGTF